MGKLRRGTQTALSETGSLRVRAAWLYHNHGLTQKDVAERLGVSRTTVIRLLDEARRRNEVLIWIDEGERTCVDLAARLEDVFGLDEALVVPEAPSMDQTNTAVGLALGKFLSEAIPNEVTIGVGWGRTLTASLAGFRPGRHHGVKVLSLMGGATEAHFTNPVEFSWRLASQLDAECFLFPAPVIVDSAETKRRLIEFCGLGKLIALADSLDIAVLSVGDIGPEGTSLAKHLMPVDVLGEVVRKGAVADVMCHFLDATGASVPHPVVDCVMSVGIERVTRAKHKVIACGGVWRAIALRAALRRIGCNTLVTDEGAARALLAAEATA